MLKDVPLNMTLTISSLSSSQRVGDEQYPMKDGKVLTSDVDYVDVWRVRKQWKH